MYEKYTWKAKKKFKEKNPQIHSIFLETYNIEFLTDFVFSFLRRYL